MKKYRRVMSLDTEEWCKIWRKFGEFGEFSLMCYFCQKYIMFDTKNYRGVVYRNTEEKCKTWLGTDLRVEKWHEEFEECWTNTWKSQNLHFNGLRLTKIQNVLAKKIQRSYALLYWQSCVICDDTEGRCNI